MSLLFTLLISLFSLMGMASEQFNKSIPLGMDRIEYIADPTHSLTIEDVHGYSLWDWKPTQQEIPSFGFSNDSYWFRLDIPVYDQRWLLEINYALLDEIEFYLVGETGVIESVRTGDHLPFSERPIKHRAYLFPFDGADEVQRVYLRVRSSSAIQLPITLWPERLYFEADQFRFAEHGVYYGIVLVIALYNLFLFLRLRDSAYLFYVLYVVTFAVAQMSLTGFAYQFIWPDSPGWNEQSVAVITPLIVTSGMVFVSNFLKLGNSYPNLNRIVYFQAWLGVLTAFLSTFLPYALMIRYGAALAIIACTTIIIISYYIAIRTRHKSAVYFSAAWSTFLVGTVVLAMNKFGILPRTPITESSAQIGSAVEIILLSFALAERLHDETTRRFRAESETLRMSEQLVEVKQKQNEALEVEVEQRTRELRLALEKVNKLNSELEDLSTLDQVTGVRNRRYFDEMMEREFARARRNGTELSLIMIDLDHFKAVNDTYGHQAGDKCLRTVASEVYRLVKRPPDLVCRYGGEELAVVLPETKLDGALYIAERVRSHIEQLWIESSEGRFQITASLGVGACIPDGTTGVHVLVEEADQALYKSKDKGRNRVETLTS
jgi:diguanylate cyclase